MTETRLRTKGSANQHHSSSDASAVQVLPSLPRAVKLKDGTHWEVPATGKWPFPNDRRKVLDTTALDAPFNKSLKGFRKRALTRGEYRERAAQPNGGREPSCYSPELTHEMRHFMISLLSSITPSGLTNYLSAFTAFERWLRETSNAHRWRGETGSMTLRDITVARYDAFRIHQEQTKSRGSYLRCLRRFYEWSKGLPGFQESVWLGIRGLALKKAIAGEATRIRDPRKGAFDQWEQEQIAEALLDDAGGPDFAEARALVGMLRETGARPYALTLLRRSDLQRVPGLNGARAYVLDIPRIKQKGQQALTRVAGSYRVEISERLGRQLEKLHHKSQDGAATLLPGLAKSERPEFFVSRWVSTWAEVAGLVTNRVAPEAGLESTPPYPLTPLHLFAQRFRRTLATNLAEQGYEAETIAAMLDDRTLAMAVVYAQNSSAMVELLGNTLDKHPDWLRVLKLYRGEIVEAPEADWPLIYGGAPWLDGYDQAAEVGAIGWCATPAGCEWRPPLTCYMCKFFRPDIRADHGIQLTQIRRHAAGRLGRTSDRLLNVLKRVDGAVVQCMSACTDVKTKADASIAQRDATVRHARPRLPEAVVD